MRISLLISHQVHYFIYIFINNKGFFSNKLGDGDDFLFSEFEIGNEETKTVDNTEGVTKTNDFFGKKKKKFKNHEKKYVGFFLRLMMVVITITGYYILDYFTGKVYSDKINALAMEFNSTYLCENYFGLVLNAEKV